MTFSTLTFVALFLPAVLLLYFLIPRRFMAARNGVLLAASLLFYAWGEPFNVFLILLCVGCTYLASFGVERKSRLALFFAVAVNLVPLFVYKYANFVIENVNGIPGIDLPLVNLVLPAGISFYTFQVLTYVVDLYRGEVARQKNPAWLMLYVFFFPQLIAGPIVRYADVALAINRRESTWEGVAQGSRRFVFGLFKKMLANQAGFIATTVAAQPQSVIGADLLWLSVIAYGVQIFYDFSGYSDMAIGLGRIFGFTFLENFDKPYTSRSVTEFWRRWHISLSTFFRMYVYIPLGGDGRVDHPDGTRTFRAGLHIRNLFVVWLLTGLWHGASWNFALWGLYYFVLLLGEKYVFGGWLARLPEVPARILCYFFYTFGWAIFLFETNSIAELGGYLLRLFTGGASEVGLRALAIQGNVLVLALALLSSVVDISPLLRRWEKARPFAYRVAENLGTVALLTASVALIVGESFNPFIYFRF